MALLNLNVTLNNVFKIGIIGLVEKEWVCSLPAIDYDDVLFEPFIEMGNKLAKDLKTKEVFVY